MLSPGMQSLSQQVGQPSVPWGPMLSGRHPVDLHVQPGPAELLRHRQPCQEEPAQDWSLEPCQRHKRKSAGLG